MRSGQVRCFIYSQRQYGWRSKRYSLLNKYRLYLLHSLLPYVDGCVLFDQQSFECNQGKQRWSVIQCALVPMHLLLVVINLRRIDSKEFF